MSYNGSHVRFNAMTNVDYYKIESDTNVTFEEAKASALEIRTFTILSATYDGAEPSIDSTYLPPGDMPTGATFSVYKKTPEEQYYNFICTLSDGRYKFKDYNILSNQYYHYLAAAETLGSDGKPRYRIYEKSSDGELIYDTSTSNGWTICDVVDSTEEGIYLKVGNVWNLGLNLEGENISQTLSITNWDTLGRFGQTSIGKRNYDGGSFSSLLGSIVEYVDYTMPAKTKKIGNVIYGYVETTGQWLPLSELGYAKKVSRYTEKATSSPKISTTENFTVTNVYAREVDKLIAWKEFMSDGNMKLLRDRKGNGWIISVSEIPSYNINVHSINQLTTVSFSWKEVEDINTSSVVDIYEVGRE